MHLLFKAPYQITIEETVLPELAPHEVLVQSIASAVSAGTELLVYRGQFPADLPLDETISGLSQKFTYPVCYGYATVGRVVAVGKAVDKVWINRLVFAFYPHSSHFVVDNSQLLPVPEGIRPEDALFLPNMETAVSLVMDARPVIGERVLVVGQGVVGWLITALLARFPLAELVTLDHFPKRRAMSLTLGAHHSLNPADVPTLQPWYNHPVDLTFEVSGNPAALDLAVDLTGFSGRIVIGSWYGEKRAPLYLGGAFHRRHQTLISSQVSHLKPQWAGQWDKNRRLAVAWEMVRQVRPSQLITHRYSLSQAAAAYELLDQRPGEAGQVIFEYEAKSFS